RSQVSFPSLLHVGFLSKLIGLFFLLLHADSKGQENKKQFPLLLLHPSTASRASDFPSPSHSPIGPKASKERKDLLKSPSFTREALGFPLVHATSSSPQADSSIS
ncbi:hypothetical protein F2P56_008819, partial [Juglans regia]